MTYHATFCATPWVHEVEVTEAMEQAGLKELEYLQRHDFDCGLGSVACHVYRAMEMQRRKDDPTNGKPQAIAAAERDRCLMLCKVVANRPESQKDSEFGRGVFCGAITCVEAIAGVEVK